MSIGTGLTATLSGHNQQTGVDVNRQPHPMERETGIEPVSLAWKAKVLPLNYSRPGSSCLRPSTRTGTPWWRRLDSNQRTQCGQIYSLLPLTTRPPLLRQARNYSTGFCGRNSVRLATPRTHARHTPRRARIHRRLSHLLLPQLGTTSSAPEEPRETASHKPRHPGHVADAHTTSPRHNIRCANQYQLGTS